jgi:hypothetical protein
MKSIFDLCDEYHLRSKSIEFHKFSGEPLYVCTSEIVCPYLSNKKAKVEMWDQQSDVKTLDEYPICKYKIYTDVRKEKELN